MIIWLVGTGPIPRVLQSKVTYDTFKKCDVEKKIKSKTIIKNLSKQFPDATIHMLSACLTPDQESDAIKIAAEIYAREKYLETHPEKDTPEKIFPKQKENGVFEKI